MRPWHAKGYSDTGHTNLVSIIMHGERRESNTLELLSQPGVPGSIPAVPTWVSEYIYFLLLSM